MEKQRKNLIFNFYSKQKKKKKIENANIFNKYHDSFLWDICNKIWNDRYDLCNIKNIKSSLKSKNTIKTNIQKFSNTTIDTLLVLL